MLALQEVKYLTGGNHLFFLQDSRPRVHLAAQSVAVGAVRRQGDSKPHAESASSTARASCASCFCLSPKVYFYFFKVSKSSAKLRAQSQNNESTSSTTQQGKELHCLPYNHVACIRCLPCQQSASNVASNLQQPARDTAKPLQNHKLLKY